MSRPCPTITVRQLGLAYHGVPAIADISLDLPAGEITALVGPSGCGKTTLLNCLNRLAELIPGARHTGHIHLDGADIHAADLDPSDLRRRIGMIFQRPNPFPLSIHANLLLPLREHRPAERADWEIQIHAALDAVGLWEDVKDRLHRPAQALSGGQQQRLCIARALVLDPHVLLFDEPCSALDPLSSAVVEDHILALRGRCTLVVVTHNLAQARRIADHLAVLWRQDEVGRLLAAGPAASILSAPPHPLVADYLAGHRG